MESGSRANISNTGVLPASNLSNVKYEHKANKTKFSPTLMPRIYEVEFYAWTPNVMDLYQRMTLTKVQAGELIEQLTRIVNDDVN